MYFNQKSILAADYLRLSREDGDKLESDSIRNQRSLINDFVKQHKEIQLVEEYIDDGYSGTNFDRPAFQRMLEDVKRKKINCIIVKDLSRLGRNYIETGRYLEKIFPFMGSSQSQTIMTGLQDRMMQIRSLSRLRILSMMLIAGTSQLKSEVS